MAQAEVPDEHARTTEAVVARPGSDGEHALQERLGTVARADRFYNDQVLDHLNERMREFAQCQEMFFVATSDRHGECDNSFRAGPPGFLRVLDEHTLIYPEYRGNGVHASLGNIQENPHLGLLLIDFVQARIGLHINGRAEVVEDAVMRAECPDLPAESSPGRRAQLWVRVTVEEAYIHCAKHIPHLQKAPRRPAREWGTDDFKRKGGDFFGAARDARQRSGPPERPVREHADALRGASVPGPRRPRSAASGAAPGLAAGFGFVRAGSVARAGSVSPAESGAPAESGGPGGPEVPGGAADALEPSESELSGAVPMAWRQEAERALAEAHRRAAAARDEANSFQGWFG